MMNEQVAQGFIDDEAIAASLTTGVRLIERNIDEARARILQEGAQQSAVEHLRGNATFRSLVAEYMRYVLAASRAWDSLVFVEQGIEGLTKKKALKAKRREVDVYRQEWWAADIVMRDCGALLTQLLLGCGISERIAESIVRSLHDAVRK